MARLLESRQPRRPDNSNPLLSNTLIAQTIKLTATDGTPVEFVDEVIGSGAMKDVYFGPDKSYVVGFSAPLRMPDFSTANMPNASNVICFPFMLNKNEHLIWLFRDVTLLMQKVRRETVGRTRGVSIRVCKGVYYRTGGFRGRPVETTYMQRIGTGCVCLTDKNLYFLCPEKRLKIPFSKILSLDPYSNGLGIQKDGANDKPMFFENLNSWFCYNVISNLK